MNIWLIALPCRSFVEREVIALLLKNDYVHIIQSFVGKSLFQVNPIERCILGFALLQTGFVSDGLREMSLSLEQMPVKLRCIGLFFLHEAYSLLELKKHSEIVKRQFLSSDMSLINQLEDQDHYESSNAVKKPLHEVLPKSLKSRYIKFDRLMSNAAIKIHSGIEIERSVEKCFIAITKFLPIECFKEVHFGIDEISRLESQWINTYLKPGLLQGDLQDYIAHSIPPKQIKCFIHLKTMLSFSYLYENKFDDALNCFFWIKVLLSKMSSESLKQAEISACESRAISLYYSICFLNLGETRMEIEDINECISSIILMTKDFAVETEIRNGTLEFYFEIFGLLYLERACIGNFVNKDSVEEMIRKFILVSTLKNPDDPEVPQIYTSVLSGLLLYGGLEIRIFWFFNFLKQYFRLHGCLHQGLMKVRNSFSSCLLNQLSELSKPILKQLTKSERGFTRDISDIMTGNPNRMEFIAPFIRITYSNTKRLKLQQSPYTPENTPYHAADRVRTSHRLISFWIRSYKDFQGDIPADILKYLTHLNLHKF